VKRRALIGCEMSGLVRDEFARHGWDAVSADLLPSDTPVHLSYRNGDRAFRAHGLPHGTEGLTVHYQGDVRDLFDPEHPLNANRFIDLQCGYADLSQAGARYWRFKDADLGGDGRMQAGAAFFMEMVNAPAPLVAVENPVGVMCRKPGEKRSVGYRPPDQVVQPWWFGDFLKKGICLWLKGLPPLVADNPVDPDGAPRVTTGGGSHRTDYARDGRSNNRYEDSRGRKFRSVMRSMTPPGFARAMAEQWTRFAEEREMAA